MIRQYQTDGRYAINTLLNAKRNPLLLMPTGTGKTFTAVEILKDRINLNRRVFVTVPQIEILDQWCTACSHAGVEYGIINDKGIQGRNKPVYICMPLSLLNIVHLLPKSIHPDEIFNDEAHLTIAKTYNDIHSAFPDASIFGMTGTCYRLSNEPLGDVYTDIVEPIKISEAINQDYLAKPLLMVPELYHMNVKINNGDYDVEEQAEQLGKAKIIGNVIDNYANVFCGLPVMVACSTTKHAEVMTDAFIQAGWNFKHLHSKLNKTDRRKIIREIRENKINGIVTVGVGIIGLDIPGLYGVLWLRRTLSLVIWMQTNGRVLRSFPGKTYGIIMDFVGNCFIHGRPELDRQWSLESDYKPDEVKAPRMRVCPICGVMNAYENLKCHICGEDLSQINGKKERKLPIMCDGKLVVLSDDLKDSEWLQNRINERKTENIELLKEENKVVLVEFTKDEKKMILNRNLTGKKVESIFAETLQKYI